MWGGDLCVKKSRKILTASPRMLSLALRQWYRKFVTMLHCLRIQWNRLYDMAQSKLASFLYPSIYFPVYQGLSRGYFISFSNPFSVSPSQTPPPLLIPITLRKKTVVFLFSSLEHFSNPHFPNVSSFPFWPSSSVM